MATVYWVVWDSRCEGEEGQTLLEIALEQGLLLPHACGGDAVCSTCAVEILDGHEAVSAPEDLEMETLGKLLPDRTPFTRLACQTRLLDCAEGFIRVRPLLPPESDSL